MTYKVSVRETRELERRLRGGLAINLPEECEHNRDVLLNLLCNYGPIVVPLFSSLTSEERRSIADSVAYLVRPDLIIQTEELSILPGQLHDPMVLRVGSGNGFHLRNDPSKLYQNFKLPKDLGGEYTRIAREFFRCYAAAISFMPEMNRKLDQLDGNSFNSAFPLADMTAYLLDPWDLTDYRYSEEEVSKFHEALIRQRREI